VIILSQGSDYDQTTGAAKPTFDAVSIKASRSKAYWSTVSAMKNAHGAG